MDFMTAELELAIAEMKKERVWEMDYKLPYDCMDNITSNISNVLTWSNGTCEGLKDWFTKDGISEKAKDFKNFQNSDAQV